MAIWTLNDIMWREFDVTKVRPELVSLVKAACLVEYNGHDYARYLHQVFAGDAAMCDIITQWAQEEVQHGQVLRRWAEMADPEFDFEESFRVFIAGYKLPENVKVSVRGSRAGEMLARCVVEAGTSAYYTAMKEYANEPVLKAICTKIAADEFRHYKLFYTLFNQYIRQENPGIIKRARIVLGRIIESEDDELAYAFFAANRTGVFAEYTRKEYARRYLSHACLLYRRRHIERMSAMILKAAGLKPHTRFNRMINSVAWNVMQFRGGFASKMKNRGLLHKSAA